MNSLYKLAHSNEGVGSGFEYKTVPHITLKSIANNEPPATETLYDRPFIDKKKARVTGPFTVEAVPAPVVKSFEEFHPLSPPPAGDTNVPLIAGDSGGGAKTGIGGFWAGTCATGTTHGRKCLAGGTGLKAGHAPVLRLSV